MSDPSSLRALVTAGSKYGATAEIARHIAARLEHAGLDVVYCPPGEAGDPGSYDAIVLGSAVYIGHWTAEAMELARSIGRLDPKPPVWIFSSGPVGDSPKPTEDPVDVSEVLELTEARDHRVLKGKIDKSKLSFGEKAILIAVRATEGDYRDWDAIDEWSETIAEELVREEIEA
jgi:menaquinone-dependent protoporphyrinogen oxidase